MAYLSFPPFFSRPRRASFSSKESSKGDGVCQQLTKKLQNLKKKIKHFEEQFEKDKNYMVGIASYNTVNFPFNPFNCLGVYVV